MDLPSAYRLTSAMFHINEIMHSVVFWKLNSFYGYVSMRLIYATTCSSTASLYVINQGFCFKVFIY